MDPEQNNQKPEEGIMNNFEKPSVSIFTPKLLLLLLVVVVLGIGSGYLLSQKGANSLSLGGTKTSVSSTKEGAVVGSSDTKTFKDTAEGVLKEGGIDGEGVYHLVRPGGDSQNVYMTSSSIDLSQFVDKKVKVWGNTQSAQHAGWLMDVGKIEVL